jgi:hypothetical protein
MNADADDGMDDEKKDNVARGWFNCFHRKNPVFGVGRWGGWTDGQREMNGRGTRERMEWLDEGEEGGSFINM